MKCIALFLLLAIISTTCIKADKDLNTEFLKEQRALIAISAIQTQLNSILLFANQDQGKLYSNLFELKWVDSSIADGTGILLSVNSQGFNQRNDGLVIAGNVDLHGNKSLKSMQDTVLWRATINDSFKIITDKSQLLLVGEMKLIKLVLNKSKLKIDLRSKMEEVDVQISGDLTVDLLYDNQNSFNPPLVLSGSLIALVDGAEIKLKLQDNSKNSSCNTLAQKGEILTENSSNNLSATINLDAFNSNACDFTVKAIRNKKERILTAW